MTGIPIPITGAFVLAQQETTGGSIIRQFPFVTFRGGCADGKGCFGSRRRTCCTYILNGTAGGCIAIDDLQFVRVADEGELTGLRIFAIRSVILEVRTVVFEFESVLLRTAFVRQFVPGGIGP